MTGTTPKSNKPFNASSGAAANYGPQSRNMALIVDIAGAGQMNRTDAEAYFKKLGDDIESLRERGIAVTWVTIGDRNHLNAPTEPGATGKPRYTGDGTKPEDYKDLIDMGFKGVQADQDNNDIFMKFMRDHGPRTNEAVYTKFFKGAFVEPEDYTGNPALRALIQSDYKLQENGKPYDLPGPGKYEKPTLTQYARSRGTTNMLIVGGMSNHCIVETALSANARGFRARICKDGVLSWPPGDESGVSPGKTQPVWRDGGQTDAFHAVKINGRLEEIKTATVEVDKTQVGELKARGITEADLERVRHDTTTLSSFIGHTPLPKAAPGPAAPAVA